MTRGNYTTDLENRQMMHNSKFKIAIFYFFWKQKEETNFGKS